MLTSQKMVSMSTNHRQLGQTNQLFPSSEQTPPLELQTNTNHLFECNLRQTSCNTKTENVTIFDSVQQKEHKSNLKRTRIRQFRMRLISDLVPHQHSLGSDTWMSTNRLPTPSNNLSGLVIWRTAWNKLQTHPKDHTPTAWWSLYHFLKWDGFKIGNKKSDGLKIKAVFYIGLPNHREYYKMWAIEIIKFKCHMSLCNEWGEN